MRVKVACAAVVLGAAFLVACKQEIVDPPGDTTSIVTTPSCPLPSFTPSGASTPLTVLGKGTISSRYTAEVDVRGSTAYTTTWGTRNGNPGNAVYIWNVSGGTPVLLDSVIVSGATTLGDVAISDDGGLLVVATERTGGSIVVYDITIPSAPVQLSRFTNAETNPGVHTAEIGRINGKLHAFLSINPAGVTPARLVIVDLGTPTAPQQVYSKPIGSPYVHDVFYRDGLLFLALWNAGMQIWDVGGGTTGSVTAPQVISSIATVGGSAHNIWWYHDPVSKSKAYAFVGEEGPSGGIGSSSSGDLHVIDICDITKPKEVAFYHVAGAGAHNFSMDESRGILYAAFYNGGVRALDVRGDLGSCLATQKSPDGRCDLRAMGREVATGIATEPGRFVWGVVYREGSVYLSDMNNGLWKLKAFGVP